MIRVLFAQASGRVCDGFIYYFSSSFVLFIIFIRIFACRNLLNLMIMKTKSILAALIIVAGLQSVKAQKMVVTLADNSKVTYSTPLIKDVTFFEAEEHEYVDLGLPSGTLWATCNIGATSPEEIGNFFAWGEIETKDDFSWETYKYCKGTEKTLTKYCWSRQYGYNHFTDTLTMILPIDDAALVNWGGSWLMPSESQFLELINLNYTTRTWTTQNGVAGIKITSKFNSNSIFLPTTGIYDGVNYEATDYGFYWSQTISSENNVYPVGSPLPTSAVFLYINRSAVGTPTRERYQGMCIRPVKKH